MKLKMFYLFFILIFLQNKNILGRVIEKWYFFIHQTVTHVAL
jgi:hypothetical protein